MSNCFAKGGGGEGGSVPIFLSTHIATRDFLGVWGGSGSAHALNALLQILKL